MTTETYLIIALIFGAIPLGLMFMYEQNERQKLEERLRRERDNRILSENSIIDRVHKIEMKLKTLPTELGYPWEKGTEGKWVKK